MQGRYGVHFTKHFCIIYKKNIFKAVIKLITICKLRLKKSCPLRVASGSCSLKIAVPKFQEYKKLELKILKKLLKDTYEGIHI